MRGLQVTPLRSSPTEVTIAADDGARARRMSFEFSVPAAATGDFALPLTLLPSMALGAPLHVDGRIDAGLLGRQERIQVRIAEWNSRFSRIPVDAPQRSAPESVPGGVGTFFSGGVDSFHTLLARQEEVTHLILIHGFDHRLSDRDVRRGVSEMARSVADELELEMIEVGTDAKPTMLPLVPWNWYFGSLLAAIGLALEDHVSRVLIPTGHSTEQLIPWGQHPEIDRLWSTQRVAVESHGVEAGRFQKAAGLTESDLAMRWLRVCWTEPGRWNCGRCEKCVRTMVNLAACGALSRCATFPDEIDPDAVRGVVLRDENERMYARENVDALRRSGADPEVAQALEHALRRSRYRATRQRLGQIPVGAVRRARHERDKLRVRLGRSPHG